MFRSFKPVLAAISAFIVLAALLGRAQVSNQALKDVSGTWTAEIRNAKVFLQIRTSAPDGSNSWNGDWNSGQSFPIEEIAGLPANEEHFTASSFTFDLRREAGTLAFEGAFRDGRGAGLFGFTPRAEYANEMKALGYKASAIDGLVRSHDHGVQPTFIRDLKAQGYGNLTIDEIVRLRDHGVTLDYIEIGGRTFQSQP